MNSRPLLEISGVSKVFARKPDIFARAAIRAGLRAVPRGVHAVDGVDLRINRGEVLGVAGESGCGKSTLGRMVAGLLSPSAGTLRYEAREYAEMDRAEARRRKLKLQMIFQDPFASLNPRLRVSELVGEAPRVHGLIEEDFDSFVDMQLRRAGLDPRFKTRFAHQFSGGQRQRLGIARALAVSPEMLICDESVSALDVSIQAQIINLFMELRDRLGLTYMFISHDLGVIEHIADRVAIMYLGRVVETAPSVELFSQPGHPYTQALLDQVPRLNDRKRQYSVIKGELPSPTNPPQGCHFHPRCPHAMPICRAERPPLLEIAPGHLSACHLHFGDVTGRSAGPA